jgi:hypothetical protein
MVEVTLSKLGNPEEVRRPIISVEELKKRLANTEDKEVAELRSPFYGLKKSIKSRLACFVKSNPPDSFLDLPARRQ